MSDEEVSAEFREYLAPLGVGDAPVNVQQRWDGISTWAKTATAAQIPALIDLLYGRGTPQGRDELQSFFSSLSDADETFSAIGSDEAKRLLAAAALDHLFSDRPNIDLPTALAILTASWGGRNPPKLNIAIVERAEAEIDNIADAGRSITDTREEIAKIATTAHSGTLPSITTIKDGNFDQAFVAAALSDVLKTASKAIAASSTAFKQVALGLADRIDACEEETNVFWYVFGGVSADAKASFADLAPASAALYAARELAEMTTLPLQTLTLEAMFERCGAIGDDVRLADAVAAMPSDWIKEHVPPAVPTHLFPIHRALHRFEDLQRTENWLEPWSIEVGVNRDLDVNPTSLAVAFYRERILLRALGYGE